MSASPSNTAPVLSWEKAIQQTKPLKASKKKTSPVMVFGVVAMLILAASGVWRSMHQTQPKPMVEVVVAKKDVAAGVRLGFMDLHFLDVPKELVTKDMLTSLSDADNHITKTFLQAGEPLRTSMFFSNTQGIAEALENDERAITLKLDDDQLVDHAIAPDDLVDVVVVASKDSQKYAKTICQSARVLMAVSKDQAMSHHMGGTSNKITLAVSPETAESISEAADVGKIRLLLRNKLGIRHNSLPGAEEKDLLPASAYRAEKETSAHIVKDGDEEKSVPALPPPPILALPPAATSQFDAPQPSADPLQWMVQIFSGSKKEAVGVPAN
ncbi:MAG TPA: Flp pilus assembly protein CpaB [Oculatellaceae cyanobacterium]